MNTDVRVLIIENNRILFVLEKGGRKDIPGRESFIKPSMWGLPGGRGDTDDKDNIDTALREVKEEIGLSVYINEQISVEKQREGFIKVVFMGEPAAGTIKINPEEILDYKWFPREILYDKNFDMYPSHRQMAQELLRKLGQ